MQEVYDYYYNGPTWPHGKCRVQENADDGTTRVTFEEYPLVYYWVESENVIPLSKASVIVKSSGMLLPTDAQERKQIPIVSGVLDYFPLAIVEVAKCSWAGNQQHHPGEPLHWNKEKSFDHADCIGRHLIDRGKFDTDGQRHSAKLAWRALALLQLELEEETKKGN